MYDEGKLISEGKVKLDYCLYGEKNKPLIVVLGGISADKYAANKVIDGIEKSGWWNDFIGQGKAIDLDHFQVLSIDYYTGTDEDALEQNHLRTHLQASLIKNLVEQLNIDGIQTIVGCSFGGMVALAFAELYPQEVNTLIILCAADRSTVKSMGLRGIQRKIIRLGTDAGQQRYAVSLARSLAIVGYRGELEMEDRFSSSASAESIRDDLNGYLKYNGDKFAQWFSATKYMNLSLSIDLHQIDPVRVTNKTLFIGCNTDHLVPFETIKALSANITGESSLIEIDSEYGHDFFLLKGLEITSHIKPFLENKLS